MKRGGFVINVELPEASEAPSGHVVISAGLKTCHKPYRYRVRFRKDFEPSTRCSAGLCGRNWLLIAEAEALYQGYRKCMRCWK
jgi:hypothetical protein